MISRARLRTAIERAAGRARPIDVAGGFAFTDVAQGEDTIHVVGARLQGLIHQILAAPVTGEVAGNGTVYGHIDAAQRIHEVLKAIEIDFDVVIGANAEILADRVLKQTDAATILVVVEFAKKGGGVDAILANRWDLDPQVREGRRLHLPAGWRNPRPPP